MKTIIQEIQVFKFSELSDIAKQYAIEKERDNVEMREYCLEPFYTALELLGFTDTQVYYNGFYSQGDGACFIGKYSYAKNTLAKVVAEFPQWIELHDIAKQLQELQRKQFYSIDCRISHRGMYYHENSMVYDIDMKNHSDECESGFVEICRSLAQMFYSSLQKEYEYLCSDEWIIEDIENQDLMFTSEGKVFLN